MARQWLTDRALADSGHLAPVPNPRSAPAGAGVRPLQSRGTIFWMCNNALVGVATRTGAAVKRPQSEVCQELRAAGLNQGVILMPAHAMLIGMCQERGFTYEAL